MNKIQIFIGLAIVGIVLFVYLSWNDESDKVTERVRVIANIGEGCIAETHDGFAVNIGPCNALPGEVIVATYNSKSKKHAEIINSTRDFEP